MVAETEITLTVNGRTQTARVKPNRTLLDVLRQLGHVDVKSGCEKADCGACAVLLDGQAVDSCITLARLADGGAITTVVGLGTPADPHPLQSAFIAHGAAQCGYCIPGVIIASAALLDANPDPTNEEIKLGLSGNLCRCTGYTRIFMAVRAAAMAMRAQGDAS
jgi:carbon-monoxide dehydrogenase small subunit